jgi:hypothetical protein
VVITTTSLPSGQVGSPYTTTLAASGGKGPYSWSLASGTSPSGLALDAATGVLAGFPSAPVSAMALNFKVTDSSAPAQTNTTTLPLTIAPPALGINNASLPDGQVGVPYSVTLTAVGGTPPYTWSLVSGTPPSPLTFTPATAVLAGRPTATAQSVPLTFQVTDSGQPAQVSQAPLTLTIAPPPISIGTSSLPCGQVGVGYNVQLQASGGTSPYTWKLTGGSLDGLLLSASGPTAGAITGMPAAPLAAAPVTFQVTDAGNPQQTASVAMTLTVGSAPTAVCLVPARAALAINQQLTIIASTNDASGVSWSMSPAGGNISPSTSLNSQPVTVTAPATAGVYTLTATSVNDSGAQASVTIGVTDLPAVATWHNDLARDGVNAQEYALTTSSVNPATFGKLFSCTVDGAVYAQPLWVANVTKNNVQHNVVVVATEHDSVYAFDADLSPCMLLWHANLLDAAHGAGAAGVEEPVPSMQGCYDGPQGNNCYVGQGYFDIQPEVGITGTPVIDPPSVTDSTGTIYVVSKSVVPMGTPATSQFYQRLHALKLTTGEELGNSPATIALTYPGTQQGGDTVTFSPRQQNQRPGLALVNGTVYIAWASHEDAAPYFGWVAGFTYSSMLGFTQTAVFNSTPNAGNGGIWMAGAAPAADDNDNLYLITSNGSFDVTNTTGPTNDYGDSFLQLTPPPPPGGSTSPLTVSSYFTPQDQYCDFIGDNDAGAGGAAVVLNLPPGGGGPQHLVIGGGKDGTVFLLNGDAMGGYLAPGSNSCSPPPALNTNAWQSIQLPNGSLFSTGAFWNNTYYLAPAGSALLALPFSTATLTLDASHLSDRGGTTYKSVEPYGWPGSTPSISAAPDASNGIVWALSTTSYCTSGGSCGPAILRAYDATNLGKELWNSTINTGDAAGFAVKFTLPTVANGKVYVGTRGNNTGGADNAPLAVDGELDVYGLKPN